MLHEYLKPVTVSCATFATKELQFLKYMCRKFFGHIMLHYNTKVTNNAVFVNCHLTIKQIVIKF